MYYIQLAFMHRKQSKCVRYICIFYGKLFQRHLIVMPFMGALIILFRQVNESDRIMYVCRLIIYSIIVHISETYCMRSSFFTNIKIYIWLNFLSYFLRQCYIVSAKGTDLVQILKAGLINRSTVLHHALNFVNDLT